MKADERKGAKSAVRKKLMKEQISEVQQVIDQQEVEMKWVCGFIVIWISPVFYQGKGGTEPTQEAGSTCEFYEGKTEEGQTRSL